MFLAKWDPGVVPVKPELTSAPIWLELRNVPFQFFSEEGLEHIAGLVGEPKFLHPITANKTNLEVAKVFTLINLRKPLHEAVNVQFDSGKIRRILVSSPWIPPICGFCKDISHSLRHCKRAPITCKGCSSSSHDDEHCPKLNEGSTKNKRHLRRRRSKTPIGAVEAIQLSDLEILHMSQEWVPKKVHSSAPGNSSFTNPLVLSALSSGVQLGEGKNISKGDSSGLFAVLATPGSLVEIGPGETDHSSSSEPVADFEGTVSSYYDEEHFLEV